MHTVCPCWYGDSTWGPHPLVPAVKTPPTPFIYPLCPLPLPVPRVPREDPWEQRLGAWGAGLAVRWREGWTAGKLARRPVGSG